MTFHFKILVLSILITAGAYAAPNYDKEMNKFLMSIPETVVSVEIKHLGDTTLMIAKGLSGDIYAFGIGKPDSDISDGNRSSGSYSYHDGDGYYSSKKQGFSDLYNEWPKSSRWKY